MNHTDSTHYKIKTVAKEVLLYTIGHIVARSGGYGMAWLLTRVVMPDTYGILTKFIKYIQYGHVVFLLCMDMVYFRFAFTLGRAYTFNIILTLLLISNIIFSTCLIVFAPYIAKLTDLGGYIDYFYYTAGILLSDTIIFILYTNLRIQNKHATYILVKCLETSVKLLCCFLLLHWSSTLTSIANNIHNWWNIPIHTADVFFISYLLANLSTFIFLLPTLSGFRPTWHSRTIKTMLNYAAAHLFSMLFLKAHPILFIWMFTKFVPSNFYGTHSKNAMLGNIGMSYNLLLFIVLTIQAFKYTVEPFFFANATQQDAKKLYSQTMDLFIFVSSLVLLLFSLNIDWIAKIAIPHASYLHTIDIIPYLAFAHVIFGVCYNFSIALKLSNKLHYGIWISGFTTLIIGFMTFLLIPHFGHWGYIGSTILGAIVMAIITYLIGQKCYPIPYRKRGFILLASTLLIIIMITFWSPAKLMCAHIDWASKLLCNIVVIASFYLIYHRWYQDAKP